MTKQLPYLMLLLMSLTRLGLAQSASNVTTNYTWVTTLPAEPIAVAADGPRGAYVLATGNTLIQIDTKGRERWKQTLTDWPTIRQITAAPDGHLVVAGEFTGQFTVGDSTYSLDDERATSTFVAQFDSTHTLRWLTYLITPSGLMSRLVNVTTDAAGAVLLFGQRNDTNIPLLCRLDADGRFVDASVYGAPTIPAPLAVALVADSRGMARLGIAERSRNSQFGSIVAADDTLRWRIELRDAFGPEAAPRYDTAPIDLALDARDNLLALSNYTLIDRTVGTRIESGQLLLRYDAQGRNMWVKTGTTRLDSAVATGILADSAGAFVVYGGYNGVYTPETNEYDPTDYISLAGYAPNGTLRWNTRLNAPTGNDRLIDAARANNGAVLLLGKTTGTLALGSLTAVGTSTAPAYYLAQLQPFILAPTSTTALLCAGSTTTILGTYAGHFEQSPVLQLSDAQGQFATPQVVGNVPVGVAGNLLTVSDFAVSVPLAASVVPGTGYRLRAMSPLPVYVGDPVAVTVAQAPAIPAVAQAGEELVVSSSSVAGVTYQWYTNGRQPVAGATSPRFRPTGAGAYYVVALEGGCPSLPSEALNYIITATEPTSVDITIYPNPATDRLWVRWPTADATGTLTLTDLTGRQVRQQPKTGDVTEFMVNELATGIYLLNLRADGQPTQVRKVWVK